MKIIGKMRDFQSKMSKKVLISEQLASLHMYEYIYTEVIHTYAHEYV